jgi:hypothetical protein
MAQPSWAGILCFFAWAASLFFFSACGPNRAQWMAQAANQQAQTATADIGSPDQFKAIASDGANELDGMRTFVVHRIAQDQRLPPAVRAKASNDEIDAATVSYRLRGIAESQTDQGFVTAVFAMCDADSKKASANLGPTLTRIGASVANDPAFPANIRPQFAAYWQTFGMRLTAVPDRCAKADQAMAVASQQEQQAEATHQANVTAATNVATTLLMGASIYAGAVAQARANAAQQNQAALQQWQTQVELQNIDSDLRRQNYLIQQQSYSSSFTVPQPAPPIQAPQYTAP